MLQGASVPTRLLRRGDYLNPGMEVADRARRLEVLLVGKRRIPSLFCRDDLLDGSDRAVEIREHSVDVEFVDPPHSRQVT